MKKEIFVKFDCPSFTNEEVVLHEINGVLHKYKCKMTECGNIEALEKVLYRKATGACRGKPVPPQYKKNVSDDSDFS